MTERALATIRRIDKVEPIPEADAIEVATVGGWKVVIRKGEFKEGDVAVYCEIDSWIPHNLAPFLSKSKTPKEYYGIAGERLRTIKLRGQLSQGLLLPIPEGVYHTVDSDVSDLLGITKWERPVPACLSGKMRGNFPSFISKTDQERCQNLSREIFNEHYDETFEVTIKLDGSSMTVYNNNGSLGVCSRNLDLLLDQDGNSFVDLAKSSGLLEALAKYGRNIAIQGEIMGPGIQGNRENLPNNKLFIYDIYDIDNQRYFKPDERNNLFIDLSLLDADIRMVPIWANNKLKDINIETMEQLLEYSVGRSLINPVREGLVFKSHNSNFTFKVINNDFLMKGGE